jgi:NAD(P)H-quinone oxidoreductase subunit 5
MSPAPHWLTVFGVIVVAAPSLLSVMLGLSSMVGRWPGERSMVRWVQAAVISGLSAAVIVLIAMLTLGTRHVAIDMGEWVAIPEHYHFSVKFTYDRLSVPMAILSYVLAGTIGAFASKYLHREAGFHRFFVLYALFLLGMVVASLAGTIETLFAGWELVGLSSALLVAFFQERPAPARNGLWVWIVYRFSDAALLLAAVAMHHLRGEGDFDQLLGSETWPMGHSMIAPHQAFLIGSLMLVAAAGKSALVPFSGWLPRAMEGPTPSSAIFYGALSVHLGVFLLLRISPMFDASPALARIVVGLGLITAGFAYLAGSVQADIKSVLAYASLTQVAIIVVEIGLGFRYVALTHLLGHACLRTLQFLRAPTLLHDYHTLENAIGEHLPKARLPWIRPATHRAGDWLYRLALEQGYFDTILTDYVVRPFVRAFRWCDRVERRWTDFLDGGASRESDQVKPHLGTFEEFS